MGKLFTFLPINSERAVTLRENSVLDIIFDLNRTAFVELKNGEVLQTDWNIAEKIGEIFLNWQIRSDEFEDL